MWSGTIWGWWQWSPRIGEIRVLSDRDRTVLLSFELYSMARPENRVAVLVDGRQEAEVLVLWDNFFFVRPFPLFAKRGETSIRLVSALPGFEPREEGDARGLAFAIKNVTFRYGDSPCEYEP